MNNNRDYIIEVIQSIRKAKTEEEGKNLLLQNFDKLMETDEIRLLIENSRIEGPIDDYFMKKAQARDEMAVREFLEYKDSEEQKSVKVLTKIRNSN